MMDLEVADAFDWLKEHDQEGPVVVSLPDADELGMTVWEWVVWFRRAAMACADASAGPTIFAQTDRKADGNWHSKAYLLMDSLPPLLWHKIILRRDPGKVDLHRPGFKHLLAFGPGRPGKARPDVLPPSPKLWDHGLEKAAVELAVDWLNEVCPEGPIVNPFCGVGTVSLYADHVGRASIGCDIVPRWDTRWEGIRHD